MPPDAVAARGIAIEDILGNKESSAFSRLFASQAFWVTVALATIVAVMSYLQPQAFASADNFYDITRNFSFIGIMAVGMTAVIITGGIDLSVGSIMGAVAIVAGTIMHAGLPWPVAVAGGLATGLLFGLINGVLVAYVGLSSFVVTLGTLAIGRSFAVVLSRNKMIYEFGSHSDAFFNFGGGSWLGVAAPVWFLLGLAIAFGLVLYFTVWGRHLYAVGGNESAARLTGRARRLDQGAGLRVLRPVRGHRGPAQPGLAGIGNQCPGHWLRVAGDRLHRDRGRQSDRRRGRRLWRCGRRGADRGDPQRPADGRRGFQLAGHVRRLVHYLGGSAGADPQAAPRVAFR